MAFRHESIPQHKLASATYENKLEWLAIRSQNFCLLGETLYHKGGDDIWRRCVRNDEI